MFINSCKYKYTIIFSGDSGSGIQYIGKCFTYTCSQLGLYVKTYSTYPADIKPPIGSFSSLSTFKISVSNDVIFYVDDTCDYLIAMNPYALKEHINIIVERGSIIINNFNFSNRNLLLSGYDLNIVDILKKKYNVYIINHNQEVNEFFIKNCYTYLKKTRSINFFILGFFFNLLHLPIIYSKIFLSKSENFFFLNQGYLVSSKKKSITHKKYYSNIKQKKSFINGNKAIALGLLYACYYTNIDLFYSSYPITPASSIAKYLSNNDTYKSKVFQSEDEISAICASIGASYAGDMGVVGSSGPGISLMQEAMGLACILEIPLLIINIQRAGPSTGIPTMTEQSDLMQAIYGRHGEAPIPVLSSKSPVDCFYITYQAVKIALQSMTPVILLSDFELSTSYESWTPPDIHSLDKIDIVRFLNKKNYPYQRSDKYVRPWILPGSYNQEHYIGSLEKKHNTGKVSYSSKNHKLMINFRQLKVNTILTNILNKYIYDFYGNMQGEFLLISWGSLYGVIRESVKILQVKYNILVSHLHINMIYPFSSDKFKYIYNFNKVLIFELNNKQLYYVIKSYYLVNMISINKTSRFYIQDVINNIITLLN